MKPRSKKKTPATKVPKNDLQAFQRYRVLGQMMAGFIHQFRTPLHVVQSSASALAETSGLPPEARAHLDMIQRSAERLETTVHSLLTFVKGETPPWIEGSLNKRLDALADFLQPECKKRSIQFEKRQDAKLPMIHMQPQLLEEALLNLAVNGLQATPQGSILSLQSEASPDGKWAVVRIRDQGPGINPKFLQQKKTEFSTTKKDGMGLGLFFARQILPQHHVRVQVESKKGKGTTFTLYFPAVKIAQQARAPAVESPTPVAGDPDAIPQPSETRHGFLSLFQFFRRP